MTDLSGIDTTQQNLIAQLLAANSLSTAPGASPGMVRGASNWLTGAPSVPEVSSTISDGSSYGVSPVGVAGIFGTPVGPAFRSMSRDTAQGAFPGILDFPNGAPLPQPRPADLGTDNALAPSAPRKPTSREDAFTAASGWGPFASGTIHERKAGIRVGYGARMGKPADPEAFRLMAAHRAAAPLSGVPDLYALMTRPGANPSPGAPGPMPPPMALPGTLTATSPAGFARGAYAPDKKRRPLKGSYAPRRLPANPRPSFGGLHPVRRRGGYAVRSARSRGAAN